ncbi:MAG: hypothetical protein K9L74_05420 [Candidatus Izimaplasma sp.]|nr:hypothetical protein [Candidatus Izimaplasma bacterium]
MTSKLISLFLILFILVGCQTTPEEAPKTTTINHLEKETLTSDLITWYGRHHIKQDKAYFYYPGTGFKVSFIGNIVTIKLSLDQKHSNIYFSLAKDNEPLLDGATIVLSESEQTIDITFDTFGEHTIELVKRSEGQDGNTSLISLTTDGKFIANETTSAPHFLLIGASGLSGNGALGLPKAPRTTKNSSCLHSFGYLTAKQFNGDFEFVSNSGWGLAFGYNDKTGINNIQKAYNHMGINAHEEIVDSLYTASIKPDIIIVNIGGNDYSAVINNLSGFEREKKIAEFKRAVAEFIVQLREDAPEAHIFWTMTDGSQNGRAAESVINLLSEKDKPFVHLVVINSVGQDGPEGANNHASYETHQSSAAILVEAIKQYTDLEPTE